jgi:hypothetical protein
MAQLASAIVGTGTVSGNPVAPAATAAAPEISPLPRRRPSGIAERITRYRALLVALWCAGAGLGIAAALGLVGVTRCSIS